MKKLLSLVLICAMGFGMISCVESVESPSVEAIRNAKAEQLKALADYYKAQAQAELIAAEAQAAYDLAYAAYYEAMAKAKQAEADEKQMLIEQAKEKYIYELEAIKAEYEARMLKAQKEAIGYEKDILDKMQDLEDATAARLAELYNTYNSKVVALNKANNDLLAAKINLATVEAEVGSITEAAEKSLAEKQEELAEKIEALENYNAQLAVLEDNQWGDMNTDSLMVEYYKAFVAWKEADANYIQNEEKAVTDAKEDAVQAISDMADKWSKYEDDNNLYAVYANRSENAKWPGQYSDIKAYLSFYVNESTLNSFKTSTFATDYAKAVEEAEDALADAQENEAKVKELQATYDAVKDAQEVIAEFAELYDEYYNGNTILDKETELKQAVADTTGMHVAVKSAEAALDELTNEKNEGYAENTLVKALADAQKALKDLKADEDATEDQIAQAEAAVAAAQKALAEAIYNAEVSLVDAKEDLSAGEKAIAEAKEAVEAAKEMEKEMLAANDAAVAAVAEIQKAYGEGSEFREYWNGRTRGVDGVFEFEDWGQVNLIADANKDGKHDVDYNSPGHYVLEPVGYPSFVLADVNNPGTYFGFDYTDLVSEAEIATATATDDLTRANNALANMGEWQKNWDAKEAELREFVAALNEEIKEIQALVDAYNEAVEVAEEAKDAVDELKNKAEALKTLADAKNTDINDAISTIEGYITGTENEIKTLEAAIEKEEKILSGLYDQYNGWGASSDAIAWKEARIAELEATIETLEAEIEYLTVMVENAKTALDAAISAANAE